MPEIMGLPAHPQSNPLLEFDVYLRTLDGITRALYTSAQAQKVVAGLYGSITSTFWRKSSLLIGTRIGYLRRTTKMLIASVGNAGNLGKQAKTRLRIA